MGANRQASRISLVSRQDGATLAELLYVLPLLFILFFGIIEYTYVYRAKSTLNVATFEAVRAGALNNASLSSMRNALASGMVPLYMQGKSDPVQLAKAYAHASLIAVSIDKLPADVVRIVSPTKNVFDAHKKPLHVKLSGEKKEKYVYVIPNDNLYWRDSKAKKVKINGNNAVVNIQDANLLKISTTWCHKLVTPGLDRLTHSLILKFSSSVEQQACNVLGLPGKNKSYYVAIKSHSVIRMQSPVYYSSKEKNLK